MSDYRQSSHGTPLGYLDGAEHAHHVSLWPSIAALMPCLKHMRILDAGCGNGFFSRKLAALGHEVTAIDISESGVAKLRDSHPNIRGAVRSVYDGVEDLTPNGGFDLVLSSEVIEHLYSPQDFLLNTARALRLGGWIILTTPYHGYLKNLAISLINGWDFHHGVQLDGGHIKFFSQQTLSTMLLNARFSDVTFRNAGRIRLLWKSIVVRARLDATL